VPGDARHGEVEGWRLLPSSADFMDDPEEWEAWLASRQDEPEPPDPDEDPDPDDPALPAAADEGAIRAGADRFAAEQAAREERITRADDELVGAICAWDRIEAAASARKHAAVAELIRRRPAPGRSLQGPARMPEVWDEFTADELSQVLAETRWAADNMTELAWDLEVKLPGTKAAFLAGMLRESKVAVLSRAGRLTPGGAAVRDRPRRHGSRPGKGPQTARKGREGRPGGAVG
jgi:hypothetical protein